MTFHGAFDCLAGLSTLALVYAGVTGAPSASTSAHAEPRVIEMVARRFEFQPARIEVTAGDTVRLHVRSEDGVHGLAIKKFRVAEEIPRGGKAVAIEFVAETPGEFDILCSEYCGAGHEGMKARLIVHPREGGPQ